MILPTITRTAQEAILTLPREYRENSLALGASKWQTIWKVILPFALPGIVTGIILSIGRAIGKPQP
jgi:phosphate transport system permease protein